jgi:hypothetical protein
MIGSAAAAAAETAAIVAKTIAPSSIPTAESAVPAGTPPFVASRAFGLSGTLGLTLRVQVSDIFSSTVTLSVPLIGEADGANAGSFLEGVGLIGLVAGILALLAIIAVL